MSGAQGNQHDIDRELDRLWSYDPLNNPDVDYDPFTDKKLETPPGTVDSTKFIAMVKQFRTELQKTPKPTLPPNELHRT